jgi:predicted transcriptional regulator
MWDFSSSRRPTRLRGSCQSAISCALSPLCRDPRSTLVRDVATRRLVWCDATATVAEVGELMMEQYVRHVLVEDTNQLVGVVSARDRLGAYVAAPD